MQDGLTILKGPIIRINSRSLHIHDPEYFNTIYAGSGRKVNKELSAVGGYTFPHSTISTLDHDLHRKRRAIVSPYFSKRAIADIEPAIHERIDALISRLAEAKGSTIDLTCAFSAFTADVVTYHFYGSHANYISSKDFKYGLKDALTVLLNLYNLTRFLPIPATTLKSLPLPILGLINQNFPLVVSAREGNKKMVLNYLNSSDEEKRAMKDARSKSVIVSALTDPSVPDEEKTLDRLLDEGETIIFAGIDTTARTLSVALFHLLNNKKVLMKLRKELEAVAKPDGQQWTTTELEAVPYMVRFLSFGSCAADLLIRYLERCRPGSNSTYLRSSRAHSKNLPPRSSAIQRFHDSTWGKLAFTYILPTVFLLTQKQTPVSQSTYLINNDPSAFPNPQVFDPERWVKAAQDGVNLDKYMVSFSKGSRACLGIK